MSLVRRNLSVVKKKKLTKIVAGRIATSRPLDSIYCGGRGVKPGAIVVGRTQGLCEYREKRKGLDRFFPFYMFYRRGEGLVSYKTTALEKRFPNSKKGRSKRGKWTKPSPREKASPRSGRGRGGKVIVLIAQEKTEDKKGTPPLSSFREALRPGETTTARGSLGTKSFSTGSLRRTIVRREGISEGMGGGKGGRPVACPGKERGGTRERKVSKGGGRKNRASFPQRRLCPS